MKLRILLNIILSLIVIAGAVLFARRLIQHARQPAQRPPKRVIPKVLAPPLETRMNHRVEVTGFGSARPKIHLEITPQVTGIVVEKAPNFLSGKYVSQGQLLCRIDQTDYELAAQRVEKNIELIDAELQLLEQEENNLLESQRIESQRRDLAQSQLERVTQLVKRNAASENELDLVREALLARQTQLQTIINQLALIGPQRAQLQAQIASAQVELAQAQTNLDRCLIKSPVTGRVLSCNIEVGEQVLTGTSCGQIYGTDIMEVPVSIAYAHLDWIDMHLLDTYEDQAVPAPSECIQALVEWQQPGNGQTVSWSGRVDRIEAGLEAQTRTATLVVRVINPKPGKPILEMNMFCKVTVLGKKIPEVFILPRQAILPDNSVYVVVDGKLNKRPVEVARFAGEQAMILPGAGLFQKDRVVIDTIPKPVIGMSVEPVDKFSAAASNKPEPSQ